MASLTTDEEDARAGRARPVEEGEQGVEEAPPALALPAHGRGPKEKDMAHVAPRTHRDADHGGDEEGARAGRARPVEEGGPVIGDCGMCGMRIFPVLVTLLGTARNVQLLSDPH